jgi:phage-related protein
LKGDLSGISEVRLPFDTNTYRVFHVLEHEEVVYIIDAGIKKSNKKSEMPQQLIDRLKERKKTVEEHYKKNYVELRSKFVERENRRSLNQQARRPKGV